jgi:hypothetical protein
MGKVPSIGCTEMITPKEMQMPPDDFRIKIDVRFVTSIEDVLAAALLPSD